VGADAVGQVVEDRAEVQVVCFDAAEVAFDVGEVLVGGDDCGGVECVGVQAGAQDVEAVQGCFGVDPGLVAAPAQAGVGDVEDDVLADFVFVDFSDLDTDPVRPGQPSAVDRGGDLVEVGFGGPQQVLAFAGASSARAGLRQATSRSRG
jgi:hypothetical protein